MGWLSRTLERKGWSKPLRWSYTMRDWSKEDATGFEGIQKRFSEYCYCKEPNQIGRNLAILSTKIALHPKCHLVVEGTKPYRTSLGMSSSYNAVLTWYQNHYEIRHNSLHLHLWRSHKVKWNVSGNVDNQTKPNGARAIATHDDDDISLQVWGLLCLFGDLTTLSTSNIWK